MFSVATLFVVGPFLGMLEARVDSAPARPGHEMDEAPQAGNRYPPAITVIIAHEWASL